MDRQLVDQDFAAGPHIVFAAHGDTLVRLPRHRYRGSQVQSLPGTGVADSALVATRLLRAEAAMTALDPLPAQTQTEMSRALGSAVERSWSRLPQSIQHRLFEAAVAAQGEAMRHDLAVYLHQHHPRTCDSIRMQALLEPDSLGG